MISFTVRLRYCVESPRSPCARSHRYCPYCCSERAVEMILLLQRRHDRRRDVPLARERAARRVVHQHEQVSETMMKSTGIAASSRRMMIAPMLFLPRDIKIAPRMIVHKVRREASERAGMIEHRANRERDRENRQLLLDQDFSPCPAGSACAGPDRASLPNRRASGRRPDRSSSCRCCPPPVTNMSRKVCGSL